MTLLCRRNGFGELLSFNSVEHGPDLPPARVAHDPPNARYPGKNAEVCAPAKLRYLFPALPTITFTRPHCLTRSAAREKAESIARRFEQRLEVSWRWEGDALHLTADRGKARGASGSVFVSERFVDVKLHLPLHLRPLRAFVESELARRLEALLGPAPSY